MFNWRRLFAVDLGVYAYLARRKRPRSYLGKILLVAFLGTHIPLLTLFFYSVASSALPAGVKVRVLLVALVATLLGTAVTLLVLGKLLAPITLTFRGLRQYLESNVLPVLPTEFADEAGRLMADTAYTLGKLDEHIRQLESYDALTALPNRAQFTHELRQALAQDLRDDKTLAVLLVDLDGFAAVNNSLGNENGDRLLRHAAQRLGTCLREGEILSRMGSDEFAALVSLAAPEEVIDQSRRMLDSLARPFPVGDNNVYMTGSIGIALVSPDKGQSGQLLENADAALRQAKQQGRNTYRFYSSDIDETLRRRLELDGDLRGALEREELQLVYQPQIDLRDDSVSSVEVLLRWRHPKRGLLLPADFIPVAEASGQIVAIGEWVLRTACEQNRGWQAAGFPALRVAVNLSALQFQQPDLVDKVSGALGATRLDPGLLELEITESLLMENMTKAVRTLDGLHGLGVTLALDDFGTGYSSLNYLKRMPLDFLKIDQSFVQGIPEDANDAAIVTSMIALAKGLQLDVIAEGVETQEQVDYLKTSGCYRAQGFYFSRPMTSDDLGRYREERAGAS